MIRELLPEHGGSLKIGLVVVEYFPKCDIVLPSLGYQVLKFYAPKKFRKFLQGGTLSGAEWLPPNQSRRFRNLQYSWGFVSGSPSFVRQLWRGGINRDITSVLMSMGYRVRYFRGRHGSWRPVHHYMVGRVTTAAECLGLGAAFGNG